MIKVKRKKQAVEVNSSSMADIAFLLFIFFLITTTIATFKGLDIVLPPPAEDSEDTKKIPMRNIMEVYVNYNDELLVEGKPMKVGELKEFTKGYITNYKKAPELSDSPKKANIALSIDQGTSYNMYLQVRDALNGAYNELWAKEVGVSSKEFREMDLSNAINVAKRTKARRKFPYKLAEAEPSDFN